MTEDALLRRYTFKLYPGAAQAEALERQRVMHCALYNALLQQRIEAYSRQRKSLTYFDQCKEITALRAEDPDYRALSRSSMDATAQRLDRAYQAFFKRARSGAGAQSGFPRFRASALYSSIPFKAEKSGWSFDIKGALDRGHRMRVQGVPGLIRARGKLPAPALEKRSCEILWREGSWWLSLVVAMEPRRRAGTSTGLVEFDLIDSFAVVRAENGERLAGLEYPQGAEGRISLRSDGVAGDLSERPSERGDAAGGAPAVHHRVASERPSERGDAAGWVGELESRPESELPSERGDATGDPVRNPAQITSELPSERGDATGGNGIKKPVGMSERPSELRDATGIPPRRSTPFGSERPSEQGVESLQQRMAGCRRGSNRYRRLRALKARLEAREARRRRERLHVWTTALQRHFGDLRMVVPQSIRDATTSGRGDERDWGAAVEPKAKLNRRVLDQAPAMAVQMLEYKIAEAGGQCEVERPAAHPVQIGNELRAVAKEARRTRRKVKKEAA